MHVERQVALVAQGQCRRELDHLMAVFTKDIGLHVFAR
jgi:hypothetical protein